MCGSYAGIVEKTRMRQLDSNLADYIEWLEDGVRRFGTDKAKRYPTWGSGATMSEVDLQSTMESFTVNEMSESMVCGSECGPGTLRGMTDY